MRATQARIYLSHVKHNIAEIQKIAPNSKICLSVKANAYGHGAVEIAKAAVTSGISIFSVATVAEGIELRQAGIVGSILLLSICHKDEINQIAEYQLTPLVADSEFVDLLADVAGKNNDSDDSYPVHIKIDTGMARHGCRPEDTAQLAVHCVKKGLRIEGLCTHLAVSDSLNDEDIAFTKKQIAIFNTAVCAVKAKDISVDMLHCTASAGILLYPEAHFDMVRPGILTYGYFPSQELHNFFRQKKDFAVFKPVMELISAVSAVKTLHLGESVSYGRCWTAKTQTNIATLPIGYADGLQRKLSPGLFITIDRKKYPIIGRICMDQCVVDIGIEHNIKRWDEVIIFGPREYCNTAQDIAMQLDTIPYEILCFVSSRVCRTYMR